MYYLGIDLGTSAVKLILMERSGKIVRQVSRSYPVYYPEDGWSEQEPEDWWREIAAGIAELSGAVEEGSIKGIALAGQMHGLVTLDACGEVIRPAILWNDGRSESQTQYLNREIGQDVLLQETGNIAFAGFTAPKILWMQQHEAEKFARCKKILLPKDYIVYRLTGKFATDYSDASGMLLLNVAEKKWSQRMLTICGIDTSYLADLYESYAVVGPVQSKLTAKLGLPPDCLVMAGAGDNAAAALGTATVGAAACNISLGTSGTLFISSTDYQPMPHAELHSFAHADGHYHLMGVILSAASCNKWWMEEILHTSDYAAEQADIHELAASTILFLPYLMGERSPHNDTAARAAFVGLSMAAERKDMTLAVLEGVAFALRDCLEMARGRGLAVRSSKICGGGAQSNLWKRILANVLDIRLEELAVEEGPALGAAILAAVGCSAYESVEAATRQIVQIVGQIEPEAEWVAAYDKKYRFYRRVYPALRAALQEEDR